MTTAEFYLYLFELGVRISIRGQGSTILVPDEISPEIRQQIAKRHREIDRYARQISGATAKLGPQTMPGLSKLKFDRASLIPIKFGDLATALFVPHSLSGTVAPWERMARLFPADQAVFGFQALGLARNRKPQKTIAEMASYYLAQMRLVVSEGSYLLCGWSLGGYIAFEIARQIQEAGGRVLFVGLIDSRLPPPKIAGRQRWLSFYKFTNEVIDPATVDISDEKHPFWRLEQDDRLSYLLSASKTSEYSIFYKNSNFDLIKQYFECFSASCDAQAEYVPKHFSGSVHYFKAQNSYTESADKWAGLCSKINIISIPGNHLSLMGYPARGVLAERLLGAIAGAVNGQVASADL